MVGVTYLIRVLPLTLIRKEIKNKTVKSFLYYVPYVTLAVMTFPAILSATQSPIAAAVALVAAILRQRQLIIPRGTAIIEPGDSVVTVTKLLALRDISDILA